MICTLLFILVVFYYIVCACWLARKLRRATPVFNYVRRRRQRRRRHDRRTDKRSSSRIERKPWVDY